MEVTKWLKPSINVSRIGGSASVQAATRVNAEQASKCRSTAANDGGMELDPKQTTIIAAIATGFCVGLVGYFAYVLISFLPLA